MGVNKQRVSLRRRVRKEIDECLQKFFSQRLSSREFNDRVELLLDKVVVMLERDVERGAVDVASFFNKWEVANSIHQMLVKPSPIHQRRLERCLREELGTVICLAGVSGTKEPREIG